jgi:non-canonical purine NTP pyrophosphatase (RdgB/HAM1 family)
MLLDRLVFVTSNRNKLREAESVLGRRLDHEGLDIDEIQSLDLVEVVRHKAAAAHDRVGVPVLVEDTSLELAALGGFPGPLIRWLLTSVGPAGICRLVAAFGDPAATVRCIALATDGDREVMGVAEVRGRIVSAPRGDQGFGWDSTFAPADGDGRTYGEMSDDEKNSISHRKRAFEALRDALNESGNVHPDALNR